MLDRPIVVMKFGGTSLASDEGRAAAAGRVSEALEQGRSPVVVVSAMGRAGSPYATDTLLGLTEGLPTDARERDMLAATGEIISAVVFAHVLRAAGLDAAAMTGPEAGIDTDGVFGSADIVRIYPEPVLDAVARGRIPVVAGFQGLGPDGAITTLGRGGSDTTACALGVALGAEAVEIFTDVDGVMTADPRSCVDAVVLDEISADELFQMAHYGARVVHTPAAELAVASGLAVRVRNTYTGHPGTQVADIASYRASSVATAVSHVTGVSRVAVEIPSEDDPKAHTAGQTRVFRAMADAGVSLDMFTPWDAALMFTVTHDSVQRARDVLESLDMRYEIQEGLAKVTLIGAGMHGVPGVMARIAECLSAAGVSILQTADSHTTISVLVPGAHSSAAVAALHKEFALGR